MIIIVGNAKVIRGSACSMLYLNMGVRQIYIDLQ